LNKNFYSCLHLSVFAAVLFFTSSAYAADVLITNSGGTLDATSLGGHDIGQSFTATKTGVLSSIEITDDGAANFGTATLSIYSGSGNGGSLLYSKSGIDFTIIDTITDASTYTLHSLSIDSTVNITSGNVYTFVFTAGTAIDMGFFNSDGYAGGVLFSADNGGFLPGFDMAFQLTQSDGNTAPAILIDNANLAYTENDAVTQIDSAATLNDAEGDAEWNGGTLVAQITANNETADEISIPDNVVGNINTLGTNLRDNTSVIGSLSTSEGTVNNGTALTIIFNASATNVLVQQTLRAIHYRNTSDTPGVSNRTITFTATDTNGGTNNDTRTLVVTPGNDLPTLGGTFTTAGAVNDNATITPFSSVTLADAESDSVSATITFTAANGVLSGTGITGSAGSYSLTSAALSTAQANLQGMVFTPTANQVSVGNTVNTTFTLTPNDGTGNGSANSTTVITATSINDTPTDIGLSVFSINESATSSGADVATLSSIDNDAGDSFTYSIQNTGVTCDGTNGANNGSFQINGAILETQGAIGAGSYKVCVQTSDAGSATFQEAFTITVTDDVAAVISEVTAASTPTNDTTPNVTFTTDETGSITLGGSCGTSSSKTISSTGSNTITLTQVNDSTPLTAGSYSDCTVTLNDGVNNSNVVNLTSFTIDLTAPVVEVFSPVDDAVGVISSDNLILDFDKNIALGTGNITIKQTSDNVAVATINVTSHGGQLSISNDVLTINPTANLGTNIEYYTLVDATAIKDISGNNYAGISSLTAWSFTTADVTPSAITGITVKNTPNVNDASIQFTVAFDENTSNITADDFTVSTATGNATGVVSAVSASSGSSVDVTVDTISGTGSIRLDVNASTNLIDDSGNGNNTNGYTAAYNSGATHSVDRDDPNAPSMPDLAIGSDTGQNTTDDLTNDITPTISGTAEAGATVKLYSNQEGAGSTVLGSATATGGNWSITTSALTANVVHSITAKATDSAGNTGVASSAISLDLDTLAASVSSIFLQGGEAPTDNSVTYTVNFNDTVYGIAIGDFTVTNTSGTASGSVSNVSVVSGSTVNVTVSSISGDGSIRLDLTGAVTDNAGNTTSTYNAGAVHTVDKVVPTISSISFDQANVNIANKAAISVTLAGAETSTTANYSISSDAGGMPITASGVAISSATQTLTNIDVTSLPDGTLTISLTLTDTAGNVSSAVIDTITKEAIAPTVDSVTIATGNYKQGDSIDVTVTLSEDVTVSGTSSTLAIDVGGTARLATFVSETNGVLIYRYSVQAGENDSDGITASTNGITTNGDTFLDGGSNGASLTYSGVINTNTLVDNTAPIDPTLTTPSSALSVNADDYDIAGSYSENGITINLYADSDDNGVADNVTVIGTATVSAGTWTINKTLTADTAHNYVIQAIDVTGNLSSEVDVPTITEDSIAPVDPVVNTPTTALTVNENTQTVTGTHSENGIIINAFVDGDNDGVADDTSTIDATATVVGNVWSLDVPLTIDSDNNYVVMAIDAANNTSTEINVATIIEDSTAPTISVNPLITADLTPELTGTVNDNGASIRVTLNSENYTATNNSDGTWTLANDTISPALSHGVYNISVTATDEVSNIGADSTTDELTIDIAPPTGYSVSIDQTDINLTNDTALSFTLAGAEVGGIYSYTISDGANSLTGSGTITTSSEQIANIDVSSLEETTLTLTVVLTDSLGNIGASTTDTVVKLYNQAPVISGIPPTTITEDANYSFTPSATDANGDTLIYSMTGAPSWLTINSSTGFVSGTPTNSDVATTNGIVITATDPTNASDSLTAFNLTVTNTNDAPVISGTPPTTIAEDANYSFTPSAADADGDTLTYSMAGAPSWLTINSSTGFVSGTPTNSDVATTNGIVITATDPTNASDSLTAFNLTVTNTNDAPIISGTPPTAVNEEEEYSFTPTVTDDDESVTSSETQTFSIINKPDWASFDTTTGTLTGIPSTTDAADYANIVITVTDSASNTASLAAFTITVIDSNEAPVADELAHAVDEDGEITITLSAQDIDEETLTYSIVTMPEHGTLMQGSSGAQSAEDSIAPTSDNIWVYTPGENYNGVDSFTYISTDLEVDSEPATVELTINAVNDAPIPEDDDIVITYNIEGRYLLNVLVNDSDIDGDTLTIINASTTIGAVSIENDQLVYQVEGVIQGTIELQYVINDGHDNIGDSNANENGNAQASVTLSFGGDIDALLPVITLPGDIETNATALFTKVDLGVATAINNSGEVVPASLIDGVTMFAPGNHLVYWQAQDNSSLTNTATQNIVVHPLITIAKDGQTSEDTHYQVGVYLNGESPNYPVTIHYTVGGSSDETDHNLVSGELVIEKGIEGHISFDVLADTIVEDNETLTITLDSSINITLNGDNDRKQNLGAKSVFTLNIVEGNIAPQVSYSITQNDEQRSIVENTAGEVVIQANVIDNNTSDTHSYTWTSSDTSLIDIDGDINDSHFTLAPSILTTGTKSLTVTVTDNGNMPLSTRAVIYFEVTDTLAILTSADSDGDLIPDDVEGYSDSDGDGIVDYLDQNDSCNVVPEQVSEFQANLVESESGTCLRKGVTVANNNSGAIELGAGEIETDEQAENIGGIFDFVVYGLPQAGQSVKLVLPQILPIPENAIYRKFTPSTGWVEFTIDTNNNVESTAGEVGYCPPPGDSSWGFGLTAGHWCVQLTIKDGGPNDSDGLTNNQIVDPSGVAVWASSNSLPEVQSELAQTTQNIGLTIDVLTNDVDSDGDSLTISSAYVDFGTVAIIDAQLSTQLRYQPDANFFGIATINYGISDGNGGSGYGTVTINVIANTAPVATNDIASSDDRSVIIIDVLSNDNDIDNDELTITSASSDNGNVNITNNRLAYTPPSGFDGIDTITYFIDDNNGGQATAQVDVTVSAYETITITNKSGGGSFNGLFLLLGGLMLFIRVKDKSKAKDKTKRLKAIFLSAPLLLSTNTWAEKVPSNEGSSNRVFISAGALYSDVKQDDFNKQLSSGSATHLDGNDTGLYVEIGYEFLENISFRLGYVDMGEGEVTITADTLDANEYHQSVAKLSPVLVKGFTVGGSYSLIKNSHYNIAILAGFIDWESEISSQYNAEKIKFKDDGIDTFYGIEASYNVTTTWAVSVGMKKYQIELNDINSAYIGAVYSF
jgi:hypothetical protein